MTKLHVLPEPEPRTHVNGTRDEALAQMLADSDDAVAFLAVQLHADGSWHYHYGSVSALHDLALSDATLRTREKLIKYRGALMRGDAD